MKKIYIVRHAKSSWADASLNDFDRSLNSRGQKDAPLMGKVFKKNNILPDLILSSPASRAFKTALIISEKIGYPEKKISKEDELYHGNAKDFINIINNVGNNINTLMIFGHNPGFTNLINILSNFDLPNLPTCACVGIEFTVDDWKAVSAGTGRVIYFEYPKKYK